MPMDLADALAKHGDSAPAGDDEGPDYDTHGKALMEAFISAVKSSDAESAWEHLKAMDALCEKAGGSDDDDESGPHAMLLLGHKG